MNFRSLIVRLINCSKVRGQALLWQDSFASWAVFQFFVLHRLCTLSSPAFIFIFRYLAYSALLSRLASYSLVIWLPFSFILQWFATPTTPKKCIPLHLSLFFFPLSVLSRAAFRAETPEEPKVRGWKSFLKQQREPGFFWSQVWECCIVRCWRRLLSSPAFPQRPTLAVRGEVITMTASSQDSNPSFLAGLFLLLLLLFNLLLFPAVCTQNSAVPTSPTTPLFDPLTQPECTKKEHPKVSIQGLTSFKLFLFFLHTFLRKVKRTCFKLKLQYLSYLVQQSLH